jgi:RNA polymerase sporulation-specific sigma factor
MKWDYMKSNIDIDENELLSLLPEDEERIKNIIYERYGYLIDVILKKYASVIRTFNIDEQEIRCEASYGFSDGINSYNENKNASFKTFLSICIERRVTKCIKKYTTKKYNVIREMMSLDYVDTNIDSPLKDLISDESKNDPLNNLTDLESYTEIIGIAKKVLSDFEYRVFTYMINDISYQKIAVMLEKTPKQIDNTIQRIKVKMKKELESLE